MSAEIRARAEARLTDASAALRLADPRAALRERLRYLREQQPDSFGRAVSHYEEQVLPRLADSADVMAEWLDYGRFIGQLTSNGRLTAIDESGRAAPFRPPLGPATLVLFLPEDNAVEPLIVAEPADPAPAQRATVDLLVRRKLSL